MYVSLSYLVFMFIFAFCGAKLLTFLKLYKLMSIFTPNFLQFFSFSRNFALAFLFTNSLINNYNNIFLL